MSTFGLDAAYLTDLGIAVTRWGGDGITRYNWQVDQSNAGFDWYFMAGGGITTPTPGAQVDAIVARDASAGAKTFVSVPIIQWIDKVSLWDCSYPVSEFGPQQSVNPYVHPTVRGHVTDCGNGLHTDGSQIYPRRHRHCAHPRRKYRRHAEELDRASHGQIRKRE